MKACLDALSGKELWADSADDGPYSSPILVGDRICVLDLSGNTYILRASAKFERIAKISMVERTLATPAIAQGKLFIRTETKLYCITNGEQ